MDIFNGRQRRSLFFLLSASQFFSWGSPLQTKRSVLQPFPTAASRDLRWRTCCDTAANAACDLIVILGPPDHSIRCPMRNGLKCMLLHEAYGSLACIRQLRTDSTYTIFRYHQGFCDKLQSIQPSDTVESHRYGASVAPARQTPKYRRVASELDKGQWQCGVEDTTKLQVSLPTMRSNQAICLISTLAITQLRVTSHNYHLTDCAYPISHHMVLLTVNNPFPSPLLDRLFKPSASYFQVGVRHHHV